MVFLGLWEADLGGCTDTCQERLSELQSKSRLASQDDSRLGRWLRKPDRWKHLTGTSEEADAHRELDIPVFLHYFNPSLFNSFFLFVYRQDSSEAVWCHIHQSTRVDREKGHWNTEAVLQSLDEGWGNQAILTWEKEKSPSQRSATRGKKVGGGKPAGDLSTVIPQTSLQD